MTVNATFLGQALAFAILIWFSYRFVWPPLMAAIEERQKKIAEGLAAADKAQQTLAEASSRSDDELRAARVQAQEILAAANKQASQLLEKARADAQAEQARIIANGQAEVERQLAQARDALRHQVAELAVAGAQQLLQREIDAKAHAEVLDRLAAKV